MSRLRVLVRSGKHGYLKPRFLSSMNCIMGTHARVSLWERVRVRKFACSPMTEWLMMFLSVHVRHPRCCRILSKSSHTSFIVHGSSKAHLFPEPDHLIYSLRPLDQPPQPPSLSSPLQVSFLPRFSIRIETRFENNNGSNDNVSMLGGERGGR